MLRNWWRRLIARPRQRRLHGQALVLRRRSANPLSIELLETRVALAVFQPYHTVFQPFDPPGMTGDGYTPSQIRKAYGFDQISFLAGGEAGDGSNQTIAIVVAYHNPNVLADLQVFRETFGISTSLSFMQVAQDGSSNFPMTDPSGMWEAESALDTQWVHALAPGASILLVEANTANETDLFAAVQFAARQPGVSVVTLSFGTDEWAGETAFDSVFTTPQEHPGVSFVVASGDDGAPPQYPAVSPNVLAVGGTTLMIDSEGNYLGESGWSGSGGGISQFEPKPAYQQSVPQSATQRTNPDVAFDADPATGVAVYDSYNHPSHEGWVKMGGTSFAAPAWAAILAIANQGLLLGGTPSLNGSDTLSKIYALPAEDFNDITTGNNGFAAGVGYDLVTGRGTPRADLVVYDLAGANITLGGKAYADFDGDGTDENGADPGINGILVKLYQDSDEDGMLNEDTDRFLAEKETAPGFMTGPGRYAFRHMLPGLYFLKEELPDDTTLTAPKNPAYHAVTVTVGQSLTNLDFGNFQRVSISGDVFHDLDGDGVNFFGVEPGLNGVTVKLFRDANGNSQLDSNIDTLVKSTNTASLGGIPGRYSFDDLGPGIYFVQPALPSGFAQTTPLAPDYYSVTPQSGGSVVGLRFGLFQKITLSGRAFDDLDGDGTDDLHADPGQNGLTIRLFRDDGDFVLDQAQDTLVAEAVTAGSNGTAGRYSFPDLGPGLYFVVETVPADTLLTTPPFEGIYTIQANSGQNVGTLDFGNFRRIDISGEVFHDLDGLGNNNGGTDPGLNGVFVDLYRDADGDSQLTPGSDTLLGQALTATLEGNDGQYVFADLGPGVYFVQQRFQMGFIQTSPAIGFGAYTVPAQSGQTARGLDFGNFKWVTVAGRTFHDTNADGTDNGNSDPGLTGVSVTLYRDGNNNGVLDEGTDPSLGTISSSSNGQYQFTMVGPGRHFLKAADVANRVQTAPASPGTHTLTPMSGINVNDYDFGFIQGANPSFVYQAYVDIVHRPPDASGLTYWTGLLNGGLPHSVLVQALENSDEYWHHVIEENYQELLLRPADAAGLDFWTKTLKGGAKAFPGQSPQDTLKLSLISADEYFTKHGGTNAGFVSAVYDDVFHRAADAAGAAFWEGQLALGASRMTVARSLLKSKEAKEYIVKDCYRTFLHRPADATGLEHFANFLVKGGKEEDVIVFLVGSNEYAKQL